MRESWDDKSSRFDGSSNYCASCPVRRRQLGKLTWCRPPKLRVWKRTPGIMGRVRLASRWWRTTVGRICEQKSANNGETRVEAVAEARVARVHPPEEFAAGGTRIMSSTGNSARQLRFNCVTTDTELLTPVRIGSHRLIFKIYSRPRG